MIGHHRCDSAIAAALCTARYHLALPGHLARGHRAGLCYVLPERRRFDPARGEWVSLSFGRRVGPIDHGIGCTGPRPIVITSDASPVAAGMIESCS